MENINTPSEIDLSERAPGKRRIKPVSSDKMQEVFKLLQEESDESDSTCKEESSGSDISGKNSTSEPEEDPVRELKDDVIEIEDRDPEPQCMICLNDPKFSKEEIVVCDSCGISVHEECYGIADNENVWDEISVESTQSTEPWFCHACLGSEMTPACALCPNAGGAFKRSLCGRWVHLICALVVPGVVFDENESFDGISLIEIPYSNYGARKCCICADWRLAGTGITIQCDSGLCRSYFHVSCAMREGLLSNTYNENSRNCCGGSDFYAYCAQHCVPDDVTKRRRRWVTAEMSAKFSRDKADSYTRAHLKHNKSVLTVMKTHYELSQKELRRGFNFGGLVGVFARDLSTSPSGLSRLLRKAEIMNINTNINVQDFDISKLWYIPPGFTPAYVHYYMDRDRRTAKMRGTVKALREENRALREKETEHIRAFEEAKLSMDSNTSPGYALEKLYGIIGEITTKEVPISRLTEKPRVGRATPRMTGTSGQPNIELCTICDSREQQHLLVKCATCGKSQHIHCLSPPLESVPRIGMGYAWRCSSCDVSVDFKDSIQKAATDVQSVRVRRPPAKVLESVTSLAYKRTYNKKLKTKKDQGPKPKKVKALFGRSKLKKIKVPSDPSKPKRKYTKRLKSDSNVATESSVLTEIVESPPTIENSSEETLKTETADNSIKCVLTHHGLRRRIEDDTMLDNPPKVQPSAADFKISSGRVSRITGPITISSAFDTPNLLLKVKVDMTCADCGGVSTFDNSFKSCTGCLAVIHNDCHASPLPWKCAKCGTSSDMVETPLDSSDVRSSINIANESGIVAKRKYTKKYTKKTVKDDLITSLDTSDSILGEFKPKIGRPRKNPQRNDQEMVPDLVYTNCVTKSGRITRKISSLCPDMDRSNESSKSEDAQVSSLWSDPIVQEMPKESPKIGRNLQVSSLLTDPPMYERSSEPRKDSVGNEKGVLLFPKPHKMEVLREPVQMPHKSSLFSDDLFDTPPVVWIGKCYYCGQDVHTHNSFIRCRYCINVVHRLCFSGHSWSCPECL